MIDRYKLAFALIRGMGVELASKLLDVISSEEDFFTLSQKELENLVSGKNKILEKIYRDSVLDKATKELEFIAKNKIDVLYFTQPEYPQRLLNAIDAPILLFAKGRCDFNSRHIISIVGTRHATVYGKTITEEIVKDIADSFPDAIIVSGLAYGIDVASHRASIANGISTIAVLAHGLNMIYPATHRSTAVDIINKNGALLTEYTSQDSIHKGNFLARNRIVAALSDCTIVVESAAKGGALVTAAIANSYDRDVFAVPGRANDQYSQGCNSLILQNKASLISSADDLFDLMRWEKPNREPMEQTLFPEYSAVEQKVIDLLTSNGDTHINAISIKLELPVHKTLSLLVDMEFKGYIHSIPGGKYSI